MNLNKARDFYSAYYEGTLDAGLTQAFERTLTNEAEIRAEYDQFVRIMKELKGLQEPVEVPDNLHLMIRDRVDAHILKTEGKEKSGTGFFAWKPLAYGAVAAAAIIGVALSISGQGSGGSFDRAGGLPPVTDSAPAVVVVDGTTHLQLTSAGQIQVSISDALSEQALFATTIAGQTLDSPLSNSSEDAVVVRAEFSEGSYSPLLIAVPGSVRMTETAGIGGIAEFVKAVAGSYNVPVLMDAPDSGLNVSWLFENADVESSISDELSDLGMSAEVRSDGVLWISSK